MSSQRPYPGKLNNRKWEHDECLDKVTPASLLDGQGIGAQKTDLLSEVAHYGEQAGDEQCHLEVGIVRADIAEPFARPPLASIIVSPDKGVDDCVEIGKLNVGNKYNSREFSIAVKIL